MNGDSAAFPLADCSVIYDEEDFPVVAKTAEMLAGDIEAVTGHRPEVGDKEARGDVILLGTLGHNALIDRLVAEGKLDLSGIAGGWERFVVRRLRDPFPGVEKALVIVGSDRRGTAYGAFTLSEAMGVSAWVWWADVPVKRQEGLCVIGDYVSRSPSVKYRGFFINDEDWGLKPWATHNYEKDLGDIGPRTYARVCELLLRLKANMMAPAMHACTGAFFTHPESKVVADQYGIIVTTSHCEPLLFNNASILEWDPARDGDWDYKSNRETILGKLDNRVREAAGFENIYTTGLRGLHDEGLRGNYPLAERVDILEKAFADQRDILQKYLKKPAEEIPQIFVPYKETMILYEAGLKVPDDITLVWVDDNYGYIRRLGDPKERARSGGAGVYYHYSYLGAPHDYLWLCTTPPVLMYEEMKKAYDSGADRYWLLNVGDIKPAELGIQVFFELAWDVKSFDYESVNRRQSDFLAGIFGESYRDRFQDILDTYYRLAWSRKPEYMGWEREWDDIPAQRKLGRTEFSFDNYNDARQRLADYAGIAGKADRIYRELPENERPAFFEMLGYPVQAAFQMNRKFLMAQLSDEEAAKGNPAGANWAAREARAASDDIESLNHTYNTLLGGKWNGMMCVPEGFCAVYQNMPEVTCVEGVEPRMVDLAPKADQARLDGCTVVDIRKFRSAGCGGEHPFRLLEGLGYDGAVLRLGEAWAAPCDPADLNGARVEYAFSVADADSVTVQVYTVPVFPLHKGRGTRYGLSVDGASPFVVDSNPPEYSVPWKDRVLRNGALVAVTFPLDRSRKEHVLTLVMGDPGLMVQRIVIDWGGLRKSYVGPAAPLAK